MKYAALFPGQGSQFVGMGAELFEARSDLLGERAEAILGWSLRSLCLEGPEEELTRTEHAQPALFALSYVLWEMLAEQAHSPPAAAAGHSLGEYTALAAADVFDYDTALRLVARRGEAMARAADLAPSGMAALIGADEDLVEEIAARRRSEGGALEVANINAPGQVVVSGGADDIAWVVEHGRELGVRRAIPLKVAGAFHSKFMEPAAAEVAAALAEVELAEPSFPVWSNTTARPHRAEAIGEMLARQVVSPVRFSDSLVHMAEQGVELFVHVGPGDVTAGMVRRTLPGSQVVAVSQPDDIPSALEAMGTMA
ncbi:MAG: ACP S-malonyltransferase [Acidimicrobiia bacterium]